MQKCIYNRRIDCVSGYCGNCAHSPEQLEARAKAQIEKKPDPVNRPAHYQGDGVECIDAIRAALGKDGFIAHCRGTAIKYAWRTGKKELHAQDLRKGAWYLERAAQELEK